MYIIVPSKGKPRWGRAHVACLCGTSSHCQGCQDAAAAMVMIGRPGSSIGEMAKSVRFYRGPRYHAVKALFARFRQRNK